MKLTTKQKLQIAKNILLELPFELLAFIVVPIALLFCDKKSKNLPKWAIWFDDPDYGINGDSGWINEHFKDGKNLTYYARLRWLLRNRIGVFSVKFLGVKVANVIPSSVITQGDPNVSSNGGAKSEWCLVTARTTNTKEYFGYYKTIRYKGIFSGFYCRIYLGWKLLDIAGMNYKNKDEYMQEDDKPILKSVWAINPFKRVKNA
ncbi:DUF7338 family protein [Campylobacter mucosalis]|uniref:Uncharacterized protein n=1 Tax=Campylobacter mucosalis CCUG 21559 TaxID=1032067 RepID=A0A6G5QFP3_9BACT|nr:hypothetical protein [Campylobacter mucosalis]QCD44462.1 hypothetical protein CMUC_0663 [Campylobacter mucosalis CCUG 21559]